MYSELPSSPSSLLNLLASTSVQVDVFSDGVISSVKNGEVNPLHVLIQLKAMELASERIKKEIRDNSLTEADKYPGTDFDFLGNKIVKGDVKTEYDFTVCGDTIWEELKTQLDTAKSKVDERQAFLKALKTTIKVLDEITGELVEIRPPLKKTTPGLKISIR